MTSVDPSPYLEHLDELYQEHGIQVYFAKWLKENGNNYFYQKLTKNKLSLVDLTVDAGRGQERDDYTGIMQFTQWSPSKIDEVAEELVEKYQCIPSCEWLRLNGYASFMGHMTRINKQESLAQLRERFGVNQNSQFISNDGVNHDSFAEACFANFLLARGIELRRGERYPVEYAEQSGYAYGKYDFHFRATTGIYADRIIDVEIFGCPRNFQAKEKYVAVKGAKEKFNEGRDTFFAVEYIFCYQENELVKRLEKYIGVIEPFVFANPSQAGLPSTSWSICNRVLQQCREVSAKMPDKTLPHADWMLCSGKHKDRVREPWEATYRWNTLFRNIVMLGGMYKVRKELGQDGGRRTWTRQDLVVEVRVFWDEYGKSPSSFGSSVRNRRKKGEAISESDIETLNKAVNLQKACQNHGGYASIREEAGVPGRFQWTRHDLVKELRAFYEEHGKAPSRFSYEIKVRRKNGDTISETELKASKEANRLQMACHYQGGYASIRKEAGVPI